MPSDPPTGRETVRQVIVEAARRLDVDLRHRLGCTAAERAALAEDQGLRALPSTYDEFLAFVGHKDANGTFRALFGDSDHSYEALLVGDAEYSAAALAGQLADGLQARGGPRLTFPGTRVVFLSHEGYLINFIDGTGDGDPVMQLDDGGRYSRIAGNFTDWLDSWLARRMESRGKSS